MRKKAIPLMLILLSLILASIFLAASSVPLAKAAQANPGDSWLSKATMHEPRSGLASTVVNGKIYAIGGAGSQGFRATNEEYDVATNTWTVKASMPTARSAFGIAVYQNRIYCIGGYVVGGPTGVNEVYNPATDTWENKTSIPVPSLNIQANIVDGKIFIIGGSPNATLNQVYDPAEDSWTTKASVPTGASSYASAVVDSKIYIFATGLTQIYDVSNDSWSYGTPAPSSVITAAAGATTGVYAPKRIYVFGADASEVYWQLFTKGFIIQSYDPKANSWTNDTMPSGRYSVSVAVMDDLLYVVGGYTTAFRTDKFDLNPIFTYSSLNQQYTPIGHDAVPPKISVISSSENVTYRSSNVSLAFTANKPLNPQGFSLDEHEIIPITGNTSLKNIQGGTHNLTVYATDSLGNNVTSQTVTFRIADPIKSTADFTAIGLGVIAGAVCVGALFNLRKTKKRI